MKERFVARVMQIMNETGWNDAGSGAFIGSDDTQVKHHIEKVFTDAWRKAAGLFPVSYFTVCDFSQSPHQGDVSEGTGYIILPDDFYKLASFRMRGWTKAVDTLIDSADQVASVQANEYTRGNPVRPICVKRTEKVLISGRPDTYGIRDVLLYYSLPSGLAHHIQEALYIPLIAPLGKDTALSDKLFIPLAYLCASTVFQLFEKPDMAKALEGKALELIK
jgi:hypothetical protein